MKSLIISLLTFFLALSSTADAQTRNLVSGDASWMNITGTSTIHDWECEVGEVNASLTLTPEAEVPVGNLSVAVPVESIESGKGAMNRKIYGALKSGDHPRIRFTMTGAQPAGGQGGSGYSLDVTGDLQMAGVTRSVTLRVTGEAGADGYLFKGSHTLNMTDYQIDPPTAMLGTIRSGEEVTISFNLLVSR